MLDIFREREKSQTSKDRYRDFSGGVKGNYVFDKDKDLEIAYSFDQYDKSDYLPQDANDVRDYSNVQHSVRTFIIILLSVSIFSVGGDYMRDYLMSYQFANNGSKHQYTVDGLHSLTGTRRNISMSSQDYVLIIIRIPILIISLPN